MLKSVCEPHMLGVWDFGCYAKLIIAFFDRMLCVRNDS